MFMHYLLQIQKKIMYVAIQNPSILNVAWQSKIPLVETEGYFLVILASSL